MSLPEHLRDHPDTLTALRRVANSKAAFYGVPVYLVGSALLDTNANPRDWDLRVRLENQDFAIRYGREALDDAGLIAEAVAKQWIDEGASGDYTDLRWRWADDCAHQSKHATRQFGMLVDFQVYPAAWWDVRYERSPRLRMDTRKEAQ